VRFRLYRPSDFPSLYAIEEECFQPPLRFGRKYMRDLIASEQSVTWMAEEDETIAGFAIVEFVKEGVESIAYIQTIEVAAAHRRRGTAAGLLQHVEQSALHAGVGAIWLHVDTANEQAIRLYRAHGYTRRGRHEHYYARGRAAEIYAKDIGAV
jgi:ribosomal-protein-alanine N-acetyltransferase